MKKLIVSLLCILLLGSVVVGCTTGSGNPASTTDPKGSTVETSGSDTSVKDGVPEGLNFNGTNIVTSYREDKVDYFVGDVDGDVMSEALYKANLAVEERLGITREFIPLLDEVLTSKIVESILSDEPYYDYVSIDQFFGTSYCSEGLYMDLSSLPYIDYTWKHCRSARERGSLSPVTFIPSFPPGHRQPSGTRPFTAILSQLI